MDLLIQVNLKNHNGHVGDKLPTTKVCGFAGKG